MSSALENLAIEEELIEWQVRLIQSTAPHMEGENLACWGMLSHQGSTPWLQELVATA